MNYDFARSVERGTGRCFSLFDVPAACYPADAIDGLARAMSRVILPSSRIPSGYVYLGQFIAHDLSRLDPTQGSISKPSELRQMRAPMLNLENVYGEGFDDPTIAIERGTGLMKLDRASTARCDADVPVHDLPRDEDGRARIPDDRDDENLLVAQLHVAFLELHNLFCRRIRANDALSARAIFEAARRQTILHYQEMVLYDFLPTIAGLDTWRKVLLEREAVLWPSPRSQMPIEFAVAAFQFGHSMVRRHYTLNARLPLVDFDTLFAYTGLFRMNGQGRTLPSSHRVDWRLFFAGVCSRTPRFMNYAMRIGPATIIKTPHDRDLLAKKSLRTAQRCGLGDAQHILKQLRSLDAEAAFRPLTADELNPEVYVVDRDGVHNVRVFDLIGTSHPFATSTPLSYYLLAEALATRQGLALGPLGGQIVAETLWHLARGSSPSILFERRDERFIPATGRRVDSSLRLRMSDLLGAVATPV